MAPPMQYRVTIDNTGEVFRCAEEVNVLAAMEQACCHGIPVGCRNGGCGACKVSISAGRYSTRKMNRAVVSAAEEAEGCVLACKTYPNATSLSMRWAGCGRRPSRQRMRRSLSGSQRRRRFLNPTRRHEWH